MQGEGRAEAAGASGTLPRWTLDQLKAKLPLQMGDPAQYVRFLPLLGGLLALLCLVVAYRSGKRLRLVENLPTSRTTGVFIGLVELKGTAESAEPLTSYLAAQPCVHYQYRVEEHWSRTVTETYTDSDGKTRTRTRHESGWSTVDDGGETIPFICRTIAACCSCG